MKTRIILLAVAMGFVLPTSAQQSVSLDGEWQLMVNGQCSMVQVPHTYNIMEGLEDYAGEAVYQRQLPVTGDMKGRTVRLHFDAVYHDAIVLVNGQKVGEHLNTVITRFHWVQDRRMLDDMDEAGMLAQEELSWWQQPARTRPDAAARNPCPT